MSAILTDLPTPVAAWRRPAITLGLLLVAVVLLYRETALTMVGIWARSDTFAHAFLVPPISLWLIWRGRDRLVSLAPRPSLGWLLPLGLSALAWFLGDLVNINAVTQLALVTIIICAVPLVLGWPATRVMLFPLLYLYFCVPIGEFLLPVLMERTADFTVAALRVSGIPVYREGLQFVIPSGSWSVVEACSGVRYLIASLMVGSLFAYLNYQTLWRRLTFVAVSIVVPIVANWLRAYIIVMLGHLSDNRIATGVDHLVYGWVFFGIVISIMFMIGARWSEPDRPYGAGSAAVQAGASGDRGSTWPVLAALVLLAVPHAAGFQLGQRPTLPVQFALPMASQGGWNLVPEPPRWRPRFEGAALSRDAVYRRNGRTVGVHLAYYRAQGPNNKLVSSQNVLVPSDDQRWQSMSVSTHDAVVDGQSTSWRRTHLIDRGAGMASARSHLTVWQLYWVDGSLTHNDIAAKLLGVGQILAGRGDDSAAVVVYAFGEPAAGGDSDLTDFVGSNFPAVRHALEQARASH